MRKQDLPELLFPILCLIAGILFIVFRNSILQSIVALAALVLLGMGLWGIVSYVLQRKKNLLPPLPVLHIALVVAALILLSLRNLVAGFFPALLGIGLLVTGGVRCAQAIFHQQSGDRQWWTYLVQAALVFLFGILILANIGGVTATFALLIGLGLILYSLAHIIDVLTNHRFTSL